MSYNIDNWETVALEDFSIPFEFNDRDVTWHKDNHVTVSPCENGEIEAVVKENVLYVDKFELSMSGSGHALERIKPLLERSKGFLDAVLVWEGGDSIERFTVKNGDISSKGINVVQLVHENEALKQKIAKLGGTDSSA